MPHGGDAHSHGAVVRDAIQQLVPVVGAIGAARRDRGHPHRAVIRAATTADLAAISSVQVASARVAFAHIGPVERMEPVDFSSWFEAADTALVAEDSGEVVGVAFTRGCELQLFYTHPRVWGRGMGRALLGAAEDAFRSAGCTEATLWTEERNQRPLRIYAAAGWLPDGGVQERDWLGVRIRELRLRKPL